MKYDFDTLISRNDTGSLKWDKYGDQDVIPVWVADMDFPLAPEIQQALTDRLQHPVFGYTRASARLYDVLIQHISSVYGWSIEKEWINWIPGVVSGLAASTRAYASPGSEIVVNPPIYHHFFQVHDESRNKLVKVPLCVREGRWTYDLEAMKQSIGPDTSLILLCSPHNPTGTVFTQQELDSVCELAAEVDAVVVSDEIHCGLVLDSNTPHVPTVLASPQNQDRIVTLMSASKTFNLAGLNCSYSIIPNPELQERFNRACAEIVPMVGTLAFTATEAAFESAEPWRQALLEYLRANRDWLQTEIDSIPGLKMQSMQATYLAWIDATELGLNDTTGFFERHGIGFSSGEQFGQAQYLRLNFACPRARLEEVVSRIRGAVATL